MRDALKKIARVLRLGEDAEFVYSILDSLNLRPRDLVIGSVWGLVVWAWAAISGLSWLDRVIYCLSAVAILLAVIALWRAVLNRPRSAPPLSPPSEPSVLPEPEFVPDTDPRELYFQILKDSEWKRTEERKTTDRTHLRHDWLAIRLRDKIHEALLNSRLVCRGRECGKGTQTTPEKDVPVGTWNTVEILFDDTLATCAAFEKGYVSFERGRMAWVGIKVSNAQFFQLFPLGSSTEWAPIHLAIKHIRERIGDTNGDKFFPDTRSALRQAAYDGDVHMRGRKQLAQPNPFGGSDFDVISTDIDRQYWAVTQLLQATTSAELQTSHHTLPLTAYAWGPKGVDERNYYSQLLVNWQDIIKKWPA
jgi:hypothetical protein